MATIAPEIDRAAVEERTLRVVRDLLRELGSGRVAETASLDASVDRDLGLGSLEIVELLVRLEREFGVRLPDDLPARAETPRQWAKAIAEGDAAGGQALRYDIVQPAAEAPAPPAAAVSFLEVLRGHAERDPSRTQIHLLEDDLGTDLSYGDLLERSGEVAAGLVQSGLKPNETVAVMLPTGQEFFYAFLGIMLAGGIAVPIYPPANPRKLEEYVQRQVKILANAQVRFLISWDQVKAISRVMSVQLPSLKELTSVGELRARGRGYAIPQRDPAEAFFIQYTSGSTGDPKGVTLTHANVLANVQGIGWAVKANPADIVVSWLPLYHDMGLIGSWLFSLFYGFPITIMSPLDFLVRPERWLRALSDSRGTLCPAPNFSYELCARKIADDALVGLDLSPWRVVINAGEPVLPDTLDRFTKRFAPYGFDPTGWIPCYGLAESSVALSFPPIPRLPVIDEISREALETRQEAVPAKEGEAAQRFVANGMPLPGHEVKIVDAEGGELGERRQGRLLFRGPSRTAGYYRNPEATAKAIDADGWMDSGDLAYRAKGEIHITGRSKELIIKGGHNLTPHEIEQAAADVEGIRRGCVAAFGAVDAQTGTERIVVVAETRSENDAERTRMTENVMTAVTEAVGVPPDEVVLAKPQTIPKTSSGKIRRNETNALYEAGRLAPGKRSPAMQVARLWLGNAGSWIGFGLKRGLGATAGAVAGAMRGAAVYMVALLARLAPTRAGAAWMTRPVAGWLARREHAGLRLVGDLPSDGPVLVAVNRATRADALGLTASLPGRFLLMTRGFFGALPGAQQFLLDPMVVPAEGAADQPPGGTLDRRVVSALGRGYSVVVPAESRIGEPAQRSRFRLEPLLAAAEAGARIVPAWIAENGEGLELRVGPAIAVDGTDGRELVAARDELREELAKLSEAS